MAIPPRTAGRPAPGSTNYQGTGAPDPQLDPDEDRIPAFDPDYDRDDRDKDRSGSATNKNVNTVTGGNVTIGDVGSNNVTRINAKNKAQEFKKKKEAAESEEAKADTDADVSNETKQEKEEMSKDAKFTTTEVKHKFDDPRLAKIYGPDRLKRPSGIPERSVTVRNPDGSKGGFRDYGYGGTTDRRDGRTKKGRAEESGFMYGGSGGYNFNRGGGRTPMRRGAGIRRTGRG